MTRAAHVMTASPQTIRATETCAAASHQMERLGLRHLPVVDDTGRLVGMLSDRDLRGPLGGAGRVPAIDASISTLMSRDLVTARPDDDLGTVARRIIDRRIGAVPVVDDQGVPIGILSYVDVLRRLADDADEDARAIERMDR